MAFGCEPLGGTDWGAVDTAEVERAVRHAYDEGITLFDTADVYGLGMSEALLASALGSHRKDVVIATKFGVAGERSPDGGRARTHRDASPAAVVRCLEASLKRLKLEQIALYQLHWPDPSTPIGETLEALAGCVESGKVQCIGACNVSESHARDILAAIPLASVQLPLSLIDTSTSAAALSFCRERGVSTLAYGCLAQGLLTGKYGASDRFGEDDRRSRLPHFRSEEFRNHEAGARVAHPRCARVGKDAGADRDSMGTRQRCRCRDRRCGNECSRCTRTSERLGGRLPPTRMARSATECQPGESQHDESGHRRVVAVGSGFMCCTWSARRAARTSDPAFSMVELLVVPVRSGPARQARRAGVAGIANRFILSKGHGCAALYAVLAETGFFPVSELSTFYQNGFQACRTRNSRRSAGYRSLDRLSRSWVGDRGRHGSGRRLRPAPAPCFCAAERRRMRRRLDLGACPVRAPTRVGQSRRDYRLQQDSAVSDRCGEVIDLEPLGDKWRSFGWAGSARSTVTTSLPSTRALSAVPFDTGPTHVHRGAYHEG